MHGEMLTSFLQTESSGMLKCSSSTSRVITTGGRFVPIPLWPAFRRGKIDMSAYSAAGFTIGSSRALLAGEDAFLRGLLPARFFGESPASRNGSVRAAPVAASGPASEPCTPAAAAIRACRSGRELWPVAGDLSAWRARPCCACFGIPSRNDMSRESGSRRDAPA